MYKYKYNEEYIVTGSLCSMTRLQSGPIFKLATPKTNKFRNSISYLGRKEWNCFPSYTRCIDEYSKFKKEIKLLFNHC